MFGNMLLYLWSSFIHLLLQITSKYNIYGAIYMCQILPLDSLFYPYNQFFPAPELHFFKDHGLVVYSYGVSSTIPVFCLLSHVCAFSTPQSVSAVLCSCSKPLFLYVTTLSQSHKYLILYGITACYCYLYKTIAVLCKDK